MFKRKAGIGAQSMPTSEDLAKWGAYELSFEELLEVNGENETGARGDPEGEARPVREEVRRRVLREESRINHRTAE